MIGDLRSETVTIACPDYCLPRGGRDRGGGRRHAYFSKMGMRRLGARRRADVVPPRDPSEQAGLPRAR
jgi:hypothetical protein